MIGPYILRRQISEKTPTRSTPLPSVIKGKNNSVFVDGNLLYHSQLQYEECAVMEQVLPEKSIPPPQRTTAAQPVLLVITHQHNKLFSTNSQKGISSCTM